MHSATMKERFAKMDRNPLDCMPGKAARITCGIVSPMMKMGDEGNILLFEEIQSTYDDPEGAHSCSLACQ